MIRISGSHLIEALPEKVWPWIFDPNRLMSLIPGCQEIWQESESAYRARIQVGIAAVSGTYDTYVQVVKSQPFEFCSLEGDVRGSAGAIQGKAEFGLEQVGEQSRLTYEGEAIITGALATLNTRLIESVVQMLIKMGMANLNKKVKAEDSAAGNQNTTLP
jgi:2-furoyl-CoA dehydrogenase large subunit